MVSKKFKSKSVKTGKHSKRKRRTTGKPGRAHMTNDPGGRFVCQYCERVFGTSQHLVSHVRTHTGEKPFTSSTCNKSFTGHPTIIAHRKIHLSPAIRQVFCDHPGCDRVFLTKNSLQRHTLVQHGSGKLPFPCNYCDRAFATNVERIQHTRTHTGEKPFKCPFCPYLTANQSDIKRHIGVRHCQERAFACPLCNKRYKQNDVLKHHLKTHAGLEERQKYQCDHCDKKFVSHFNLSNHQLVHQSKPIYKCEYEGCGKLFARQCYLADHYKTHEKPHKCTKCSAKYGYPRGLQTHV